MNITEKLLEARRLIKETAIQKEGQNGFTKFSYFTPSQVSELVNGVCQKLKIVTSFSLKKDEFGLYGELKIVDTETWEEGSAVLVTSEMRTEMPEMKGVNATQMMGSCDTYTKRYMLMSAFDITDNNLDPDSQDNTPKSEPKPQTEDKGMDVSLAARNCNSVLELEILWETLSIGQRSQYKDIINIRKKELI